MTCNYSDVTHWLSRIVKVPLVPYYTFYHVDRFDLNCSALTTGADRKYAPPIVKTKGKLLKTM